jgi:hypothetical protein
LIDQFSTSVRVLREEGKREEIGEKEEGGEEKR